MKRVPKTLLLLVIGIVIFLAYLYLSDFTTVVKTIASAQMPLIALAAGIDVVCIGLFALAWHLILKDSGSGISYTKSFSILLASIFGDLMIPTASISGELLRIGLTNKKGGVPLTKASASVLLHRLLHGLSFGIVIAIAIVGEALFHALVFKELKGFIAAGIAAVAFSALGLYALFNVRKMYRITERTLFKIEGFLVRIWKHYNRNNAKQRLMEAFEAFNGAVVSVRRGTLLAAITILTVRWIVLAFVPLTIFISLGYYPSYWAILLVCTFVSLVQMIPVGIPGLLGIMEVSMTAAFAGFGIPIPIATSATILTRLVIFWFELVLGGIAAIALGASLAGARGSCNSVES